MGKKKQQKAYKLNHKKDPEGQQTMKNIMQELAVMKQKKRNQTQPADKANIDIGMFKKKIKKDEKAQKYKEKQEQQERIKSKQQQQEQQAPASQRINIFAVDSYDSGIKTVINQKNPENQMRDQRQLADQTQLLMGGDLNLTTFGQKPLKIVQEEEAVQLSEDEDQPNSLKSITHSNLKIPQGSSQIKRSKQIKQFRQKLPIYMKEQQIVETINHHLVTLICGETGSGKSTQIGQFLLQKNYQSFGKIAITQPRRLATIALANRVAQETHTKLGQLIGYQVRHDRKDSSETFIKYLTDGILLNQMSSDNLLLGYSVVVIDEAHERKVNTDILIGLLSRLVLTRYEMSIQKKCLPLRLVIMSATMRIQDFQNEKLFNFKVPIINVEARMFPVTTYFQKNTPEDYKSAAVKKCMRIHRKLPDGDVLVFMTGKQQIHQVANMLELALSREQIQQSDDEQQMANQQQIQGPQPKSHQIHCLYSSLPLAQQQKIFNLAPANCRKFIISTNIAETSITIPHIRYVVDSGQEKHRYHEGVWKWRKGWGSRAMAQQRAGRAGRTTHGYCYRLYSSALYANIMDQYPLPEISKLPLQGVLLQLKAIGISNVFSFPFPTTPSIQKIAVTLTNLNQIKAIQGNIGSSFEDSKITELGNVLSFLPLDPKLGKILLMGRKSNVAKYSLLLVILLTVESIFLDDFKPDSKLQWDQGNQKANFLEKMRAKSFDFKNTYQKFIMEGHYGQIFTCINILGSFFTQLYKEQGNVIKKVKRISNQLNLNENVMRDIYYNTDQVAEIYQTLSSEKIDLTSYKSPLANEVTSLLDILLTTFIHNLSRLQQKNRYKNKQDKTVFIHHLSDTYLRNNLFLGCTQFYGNQQGRTYMRYPFPIKNYQLLATFGKVNPPTQFIWKNNQLTGLSTGTIYNWEIPNLFIEEVTDDVKYVYVARFFLEGKIFQQMKVFQKYLKAPTSIIKPSTVDYKVQKIVQVFNVRKIWQLSSFLNWWRKDRKFLKQQVRLWVQMKNYDEVYEKVRERILQAYPQ